MFERMEIAEFIYESMIEISYKQSTRAYATRFEHSRQKREESDSSHTYYETSESVGKLRKRNVD